MDVNRILSKLDSYFAKNDYIGAQRHLEYWLSEAVSCGDDRSKLVICNELIGLSRKIGKEEQTFKYTSMALDTLESLDMTDSITAATTYINVATANKAFGKAEESLPFFDRALKIYEAHLDRSDSRLGGLYNNLALSLVDLGRFSEAYSYYEKAINVMKLVENGELEQAITYLNIASALELELGLLDADEKIAECISKATELLDIHADSTDGYYAFVCEKCASVFGYYGYFMYENELKERASRIYERN